MTAFRRISTAFGAAWLAFAAAPAVAAEIALYTTREPGLIKPLIDAYQAKAGVTVNTVFVKDGLVERLGAEGSNSPADLVMTVDLGALVDIAERGLTQPVKSAALEGAIPPALRDPAGGWFSLSLRARVLYAAKEVATEGLTYEKLADPSFKRKVCIRSGQHPYNTALVAAFIAHHGPEKAEEWLKGVKANLARKPGGGDRDVAKDIVGGLCDVGLANSYYVGQMRSGKGGPQQEEWGKGIKVALPTFEGGGTHVNVSGAALAKHAPNRDAAVAFLEWLVSDEAQKIYARANYEYPVKAGAPVDPLVAELGALKPDEIPLAEIAKRRKQASELVDKVGFDQ